MRLPLSRDLFLSLSPFPSPLLARKIAQRNLIWILKSNCVALWRKEEHSFEFIFDSCYLHFRFDYPPCSSFALSSLSSKLLPLILIHELIECIIRQRLERFATKFKFSRYENSLVQLLETWPVFSHFFRNSNLACKNHVTNVIGDSSVVKAR